MTGAVVAAAAGVGAGEAVAGESGSGCWVSTALPRGVTVTPFTCMFARC
jgi:hypothetical protein